MFSLRRAYIWQFLPSHSFQSFPSRSGFVLFGRGVGAAGIMGRAYESRLHGKIQIANRLKQMLHGNSVKMNSLLHGDYNNERKQFFIFIFTIYKLRTSKLAGWEFVKIIHVLFG